MEYNVHLKVKLNDLPTILATIKDSAEVVKIEQVQSAPATPAKTKSGYRDGKRNKGISGFDLVLATLANGHKTQEEMETAFEAHGFARSSTSPSLSRCREEKRITFDTATEKWRKI